MQRRVTALLGPRRYGKTSVIRRVTTTPRAVGPDTVWIDFFGLTSLADVASASIRGLAATTVWIRRVLDGRRRRVAPALGRSASS